MKSDSELSEYQKRIEATDNVILCVAMAESMIAEIGKSLAREVEFIEPNGTAERKRPIRTEPQNFPWRGRRHRFR